MPKDTRVTFEEVPARKYAVIRFSWAFDDKHCREHEQTLRWALGAQSTMHSGLHLVQLLTANCTSPQSPSPAPNHLLNHALSTAATEVLPSSPFLLNRQAASRDGLALSSNPQEVQFWGYNPPWTLPWCR